jgi:hypothetical protein
MQAVPSAYWPFVQSVQVKALAEPAGEVLPAAHLSQPVKSALPFWPAGQFVHVPPVYVCELAVFWTNVTVVPQGMAVPATWLPVSPASVVGLMPRSTVSFFESAASMFVTFMYSFVPETLRYSPASRPVIAAARKTVVAAAPTSVHEAQPSWPATAPWMAVTV